MIVACPSCNARYLVDASKIGRDGRMVKCAKCEHTWVQAPEPADDLEPLIATPPDGGETTAPAADGGDAAPREAAATDAADGQEPGDTDTPETGEAEEPDPGDWPDRDDAPSAQDAAFEEALRRAREPSLPALPREPSRWPARIAWLLLIVVVAGVAGGAVVYRDQVVSVLPAAKRVYDFIGLSPPVAGKPAASAEKPKKPLGVRNVAYTRQEIAGVDFLNVNGEIVNPDAVEQTVPNLRVLFFDDGGQIVKRWVFPAPQPRLAAAEAVKFATQIRSPPASARRIEVGLETGS